MKIVMDTSFLVTATRWKIDWWKELAEHRLYIIPAVEDELGEIAKGKGRDAVAARIALVRLEHAAVLPQPAGAPTTDAALLELAREGWVVATQDTRLRARVRKAGGRVAYIRQRKMVTLE